MEILAKRLLELRKKHKWNQEEVAVQCGMVLRTYRRYESGEIEPKVSAMVKFADLYHVSLDYLAGRTGRREFEPWASNEKTQAQEEDGRSPQ